MSHTSGIENLHIFYSLFTTMGHYLPASRVSTSRAVTDSSGITIDFRGFDPQLFMRLLEILSSQTGN